MFYLHLSNKTENLIRQLIEVQSLVKNRDPFHPEFFLIQSQGMERMLSQQLSTHFVAWCNYEYLLPTRFFALMADRLGLEGGAEEYGREQLHWRLEQILRNIRGEEFSALSSYVSGESKEIKRYQLAGQLAYMFDQYQIMRLDMVDSWERGRLSCSTNKSAELYQMKLWNILREEIGHSRHRGVFLRDLITHLQGTKVKKGAIPRRLSVFGLHSIPPLFLHCLQALSRHCHVHFYLLSPCEKYWADQGGRRTQMQQEMGEDVSGHPLLRSLGQQGREFQNMLLDVEVSAEFKSFEDVCTTEIPCLLHRIQSDLLLGEVSKGDCATEKDDSLAVISAHSPHREIQILRDRILHWLDQDRGLELKDIVVMTPEIQDYSALIPALFHDIPHSIADKNPAFSNTCIAAFLQFLALCGGRFGWREVLELFEREDIYPCFHIVEADLVQLRHWVLSSGIRWGLSVAHKQQMGLSGGAECTWQSGLDRLFMGYAVNAGEPVDGVLPYEDIEGGMAAPLGGFSLFCEILEQAQKQFSSGRSLSSWSELLSEFIEKLFAAGAENSDNLTGLHKLVAGLGQEYADFHQEEVRFEVICSWLETAAGETKSSSGFLRGQLTFCSMLPMRSIPFKKVCLLGLNDTVFPKNDFHPHFDLLGESFQLGDRSRRSDDRYQFLEAILSARESLYLSYVGQSIRSNDQLPPSVVVSELLELLKNYGVTDVTAYHPLHAFSAKYFRSDSGFFTYTEELLPVVAAMDSRVADPEPWWCGYLQEQEEEVVHVSVEELFAFFGHPQRYFVRKILGFYLNSIQENHEDHEPFVLDFLQGYLIDQELVKAEFAGEQAGEQTLQNMQVAGRWPLGAPGKLQFKQDKEERSAFVEQIRNAEPEKAMQDCFIDLQVNGVQISGMLPNVGRDGSLLYRYSKLKGRDMLGGWLHHCLSHVSLESSGVTRVLGRDYEVFFSKESSNTGDLEDLLALFMEGQRMPSRLLLEPVMKYAGQAEKNEAGGKGDPLAQAGKSYSYSMEKGYEPEWELLHRGTASSDILNREFQQVADWFYTSVWKTAQISAREE